MLVVHASDDDAARYGRELPYEVLRRDASAHILYALSGITGYALFAAGKVGVVCWKVSPPSLGNDRRRRGGLMVSVGGPRPGGSYEGPSDEVPDADGKRVEWSIYPARGSIIRRYRTEESQDPVAGTDSDKPPGMPGRGLKVKRKHLIDLLSRAAKARRGVT